MTRIAWLSFAFCSLASAAFIVATAAGMPPNVASHFGPGNAANGWMPRGGYVVFMLAFALGLPALIAGMIAWLPLARPAAINLPHREYWLANERRQQTIATLSASGAWFGCLLTLFIAATHYVVLEANRVTPPVLPAGLFFTLMSIFVAVLALWIVLLYLRFRTPR